MRSDESLSKVAELLRTHHRIGVVNEKGTFIGTPAVPHHFSSHSL